MSSNYFDDCIDGRFILKTTEPQDISIYLNDGSHHLPSGLNRENGLGAITDADNMLPFSYDDKSTNGLFLTDDMVQVREPTLCFEIGRFGKIEGAYPMETNMDVLNTLNTYPDGTLISPSALTVRQQDAQIIQTPASQAITYQNAYLTDRMNEFQEKSVLEKIYEIMLRREQRSEQETSTAPEGTAPAPDEVNGADARNQEIFGPDVVEGSGFPEHIYDTENASPPSETFFDTTSERMDEEEKMDEVSTIRRDFIARVRTLPVSEMRIVAIQIQVPIRDAEGNYFRKPVLKEMIIRKAQSNMLYAGTLRNILEDL